MQGKVVVIKMFSGCRRSDNLTIQARNMRPLEDKIICGIA